MCCLRLSQESATLVSRRNSVRPSSSPNFLFPYLDYKIFHQYRPYMQGVINPYGAIRDAVTNDAINPREGMIRDEGEAYWENTKKSL